MFVLLALLLLTPPQLAVAPAGDVRVDGHLDEAAWEPAPVAQGFVQFEPDEGTPASERTEVRVLRGTDALYVGARMWAQDPSQIRTVLSRRDDTGGADAFTVSLDSYDDGRTAYVFGLTAAGVQFDATLEGNRDDESWDAVWESAVSVDAQGWTAEMRIPYSQLRFTGGTPSWGVNFQRQIPALGEESFWAPVTREEASAGLVRLFGRLEGLGGLAPRSVVQVRPYTLAGGSRSESAAAPGTGSVSPEGNVGADVKVGLGPALILDATVNPDFGQVEADPAELNLGTFETAFGERRPFFVEGSQIFDLTIGGRDGSLLYTRRVGGSAPIIAAGKLTGRTPGGLSFGALGSATGDRFDPSRFYVAGRLKQELAGQSYVGGGVTAFGALPDDELGRVSTRSAAAAADWDLRFAGGAWQFEGVTGATARVSDGDSRFGGAAYLGLDRVSGFLLPGFGLRFYSAGLRLNDVGLFRQTDIAQARAGARYLWNQGRPLGPFRRLRNGAFATQTWTLSDRQNQGLRLFFFNGAELRGFQELDLNVEIEGLGGVDVLESRGLGAVANQRSVGVRVGFETDSRKQLRFGTSVGGSRDQGGGSSYRLGGEVDWTASDRLALDVEVGLSGGDGVRSWVANEPLFARDDGLRLAGSADVPEAIAEADLVPFDADPVLLDGLAPYADAPVGVGGTPYYLALFGARDTRQLDATARAQYLFGPTVSLQLFGQLFAARGRFRDVSLLAAPDDLRPLDGFPKRRDFSFSSVTANAVFRWEYRPGSTLFVVWSQGRDTDLFEERLLRGAGPSPFERGSLGQLGDAFRDYPDDVVLVKLSYLFMR